MMSLLRSRLSGGLIDAGLASLATFIIGVYVIRAWADTPELIGVYALFFSAFGMATTFATQLLFIPAEKEVLDLPAGFPRRLGLAITGRLLPATIVCGTLVVLAPIAMVWFGSEYRDLVVPLASTSLIVYIVSPLQDHVRRVLHLDGAGWQAAQVSAVQAVGALIGVIGVERISGDPAWAAFGGLAFANVTSLLFGLFIARRATSSIAVGADISTRFLSAIRISQLIRAGKWLGTAGVFSTAVNLLVSWMVTAVAGEASLGYAEAARTLAQPIVVVSMALRSVYGPDSMKAARDRDRVAATRVSNTFLMVLWPLTLAYIAIVGWQWPMNPLAAAMPTAYVIPGLISLSVIANALNGGSFPIRLELVGANRERSLFWTDLASNIAMVAVSLVFALVGMSSLTAASMARPAGMGALGLARWVSYRWATLSHYAGARTTGLAVKSYPTPSSRLAVPVDNRRSALVGMAAYAPSTRRAELFRDLTWAAVHVVGPRALPARMDVWKPTISDDVWAEVADRVTGSVGEWEVGAVQTRSGGRTGFTLLAVNEGEPCGVVRVERTDVMGVQLEVEALELIEAASPTSFEAPRVISTGEVGEWAYAITSPLAMQRHRMPLDPDLELITEEVTAALTPFERPTGVPTHWEPAHGDFTPWNLRDRRTNIPALLDWESIRYAPPGADLVLYVASAEAIGRKTRIDSSRWTDEARAFWIAKVEERIAGAMQAGVEADSLNTRILRILADARTGDAP